MANKVDSSWSNPKNQLATQPSSGVLLSPSVLEEKAVEHMSQKNWDGLEELALDELEATNGNSEKGFFLLGIALYKMNCFKQALTAF